MPAWFRNQSASEVDRVQRRVSRADAKSPLRNGTMIEGVLRIAGDARIEYEGDANLPDIPNATPTRNGLMTADYAGKLDSLPATTVSAAAGVTVTIGGQVVLYDSEWRDIAYLFGSAVDTAASWLHVRRTRDELHLRGLIAFTGGTGVASIVTMPSGPWRPPVAGNSNEQGAAIDAHGPSGVVHHLRLNTSGTLAFMNTSSGGSFSTTRPTASAPISVQAILSASTDLPVTRIGAPT